MTRASTSAGSQQASGPHVTTRHYKVLIVGGGAAGVSVAARLARQLAAGAIGLLEPSRKHYYQEGWSLVGCGVCDKESTERDLVSLLPYGVEWLQDPIAKLEPDLDFVLLKSGVRVGYDLMVVCPDVRPDWHLIEGLDGNVGRLGICSSHGYENVQHTWPTIRATRSGTALFTQPSTPFTCGGASQKILFLAESDFRRRGVREAIDVRLVSGSGESLAAPHYAQRLDAVMARRGISTTFRLDLVAVQPERHTAVFSHVDDPDRREEVVYSMLHVTPPMSPPDYVRQSALSNEEGWIDVDEATLRHTRFPRIFALGDASCLPTSKSAAAVRRQAPVCATNVLAALEGHELPARYDGHTSCGVITDHGKAVLAEYCYGGTPSESFPFDQSKERWSTYLLNRYVFPSLYWRGILKGRF